MIQDPMMVTGVLLACLFVAFWLGKRPGWGKHVPVLVLCYFIPMALSNTGVLPVESPVYGFIKKWFLPASLVLMTLSIDIPAILRLGPKVLILFFTATFGVVVGGPLAYALLYKLLPMSLHHDLWKGFAALTGSWIGGGANFVAVGQSFKAPSEIMAVIVVADVAVANLWMTLLLYFASREAEVDRAAGVDRRALEELRKKMERFQKENTRPASLSDLLAILLVGMGATAICTWVGQRLPDVGTLINGFTWVVLLVSTVGILLSFTPARRLESAGASTVGSVFLYLLVSTIGASGDFRKILETPMVFLVVLVWMVFQASAVLLVRKWIKAPIFYAAVGSMANIGGAASGPVMASAFHPSLAPVGVLLAILGYALGTYLGILNGAVFSWIHGVLS